MLLLILSIPALFIGPLLSRFIVGNRPLREFGDGFILVSIGGLVLFHILPESIRDRGWIAFAACALGMLVPLVFHYVGPRAGGEKSRLNTAAFAPVLLTALAGVGVHAFLDGMALVRGAGGGDLLPFAVVLHRVSVGLTIWWILRPAFGTAAAISMLVLIAILTPAGYFLSSSVYEQTWFALFQAFMAGSLLHVIYRSTPREEPSANESTPIDSSGDGTSSPARHLPALLGALVGFGSVLFLDSIKGHAPSQTGELLFAARFLDWIIAAAPILLGLSVIASMVHAFLPRDKSTRAESGDANAEAPSGFFSSERLKACLRFGFLELPSRVYPWLLLLAFVLTLIDLLPRVDLHALLAPGAAALSPGNFAALSRLSSLIAVGIIFLYVLMRRGPRDFLDQITLSRKHG